MAQTLRVSLLLASLIIPSQTLAQEKPVTGPPAAKPTIKPAVPQAPTGPSGTGTETQRNLGAAREFDRVVGIIGDKVILRSEIEEQLADRNLPGEQQKAQEVEVLKAMLRDQIWIQYGKVLAPEQVGQYIERRLKEYQAEQIKDYGSFTKMNEELALIGTSWENLREIKRNEYLAQYAQSEVWRRHAGLTGTMLVTPKMMRAHYDANPQFFAEQSAAEIAVVYLPSDTGIVQLESARSTWLAENIDAAQLAERFPGALAKQSQLVQPGSKKAPFIEDFAKTNAQGSVSRPIRRGSYLILLKVAHKVEAEQQSFDDAKTQQRIRVALTQKLMREREYQLLNLNSTKVFIWPAGLLSGR